jgi:hypothetical protein
MAEKVSTTTTDLLGWNINGGGYDRRHVFDSGPIDPDSMIPEREAAIKAFIDQQRKDGIDSAALIDAYGWQQRYDSDSGIAQHLGFSAARFALLADDRIDRVLGPGAGLVFATDHSIEASGPIDLDNRQGLGAIINLGGRALQIATVYFDDMSEDVRLKQIRALLHNLEKEPTIIVGDLNSLRPDMHGASLSTRVHDIGFRTLAFSFAFIPSKAAIEPVLEIIGRGELAAKADYYKRAVRGLNRRQIIPALEQQGWHDADPQKQPTFHKLGGLALNVDYVFSNSEVTTSDFRVIPSDGASDHDAIRVRASIV